MEHEQYQLAIEHGYASMPHSVVLLVLSYLDHFPDRANMSKVCAKWFHAAVDKTFWRRVLPVESGARESVRTSNASSNTVNNDINASATGSTNHNNGDGVKLAHNTYASITDAIAGARPGDTIVLSAGHHWEDSLAITTPLRIMSDTLEPESCIIELTNNIVVSANCCWLGVSIRRTRKLSSGVTAVVSMSEPCKLMVSVDAFLVATVTDIATLTLCFRCSFTDWRQCAKRQQHN